MLLPMPARPLAPADIAVSVSELSTIPLARALALLSAEETARSERIAFAHYRLQVVKARALLRLMLSRLTGEAPRSLAFEGGGESCLCLKANPWGLHLSVSHSADQVALAVAGAPVGIDIEHLGAGCDWKAIAEVCFHGSERAQLQRSDERAGRETFFEIWTRKEAYLKGTGTGLSVDPASFSIGTADGRIIADVPELGAGIWHTWPMAAPEGYKAALASRVPQPRLIRFRLDLASDDPCARAA